MPARSITSTRVSGGSVSAWAAAPGPARSRRGFSNICSAGSSAGTLSGTTQKRAKAGHAKLLGIPYELYMQTGMFPVAYTIGTDFKRAYRKPLSEVVGWNRF